MITRDDLTGLILAGGQGRRMGGRDKGLEPFAGRPLVAHVRERLAGRVTEVLINANRNAEAYAPLADRVIQDAEGGFQGPLMGIYSGLRAARTPWLLVAPCDTPALPRDLVDRMVERLVAAVCKNEGECDIAVAFDGERLHPVVALIRTALVDDLAAALADGERKIDRWYARHAWCRVDVSDCPDAFANLNTDDEKQRLERALNDGVPRRLPFDDDLPLLGIAAWSGTGKTTLLEQLLPRLGERGLRVAVIKHAHHAFDVDQPGKDSHRLRQAGASPMLVASRARVALMMETPGREEADLAELIDMVRPQHPDLVLVEGFKAWPLPKLELHRPEVGKSLRVAEDPWVRAVASDASLALPEGVEALDLNDLEALTDWIAAWPARWPSRQLPRERKCEEAAP